MFRHIGETRTLKHNLRIASLLSFVAGMVNVTGFLAVGRLTTNITGHFAYLIDEIFKLNLVQGFIFFLYIFFFLLGSFVSNFLAELIFKWDKNYVYIVLALFESMLLLLVPILVQFGFKSTDALVIILLFAMGLQNSMVTSISKSVVRTTHLTGLFTDLGIELSQLFFYKQKAAKEKLNASIRLRLTIIFFFFIGGVTSGFLFPTLQLNILILASVLLIFGATFDYLKYGFIKVARKYVDHSKHTHE